MQVIAVGGCNHTGDTGTYAPSSYPAIVAAVNRDLAVGLTIRQTEDFQLLVSVLQPPKGSLLELQRFGLVAERTGDRILPPPFEFVLDRLIGSEGHHVPMFLELPEVGAATELAHMYHGFRRSRGVFGEQIRLSSHRIEVLQMCQMQLPDVSRIWRTSLAGLTSDTIGRIAGDLQLSGITLEPHEVSTPLIRWLSTQGVAVRLWNIDDIQQLKQFGEWGVAGLFTDRPTTVLEQIHNWNTPTKYR